VQDSEIPPTRIYLSEEEKKEGEAFRASFHNARVLGIHAGTSTFKGHANRRWPKKRFIEMINLFPDDHFLLFGVLDEIEINHRIKESVNNPDHVTVVDNKTIRQVAAIIHYLDGFISNDSGLMHIAAAVNTPVVAILGPTNPVFIHPWHVKHEVVRLGLPCSPCFYYSPRPLRCALNNSYKCLVELDVEKVTLAVRKCFAR
jgi:heptosyltransferase-2